MRRINEKDNALACFCLFKPGVELSFLKSSWALTPAFAGIVPALQHFIPARFIKAPQEVAA